MMPGDIFCAQCGQYHASLSVCPNIVGINKPVGERRPVLDRRRQEFVAGALWASRGYPMSGDLLAEALRRYPDETPAPAGPRTPTADDLDTMQRAVETIPAGKPIPPEAVLRDRIWGIVSSGGGQGRCKLCAEKVERIMAEVKEVTRAN
jgi:hypothetical protein